MSDLFRSESRSLLRSPWPCLSAGCIEGDRGTDERLERARFDLLPLMDVNRAPCVPVEARVEELGRVLQGGSLGEGQLHYRLVRLAGANDPVVRPYGSAHPLPLLHDVRVCLFDELAHPAQGLPAPVPELGDSFVNQLRCRLALGRTRLFHGFLLKLPDSSRFRGKPSLRSGSWTSSPSPRLLGGHLRGLGYRRGGHDGAGGVDLRSWHRCSHSTRFLASPYSANGMR